jgi:hypothetical protein
MQIRASAGDTMHRFNKATLAYIGHCKRMTSGLIWDYEISRGRTN